MWVLTSGPSRTGGTSFELCSEGNEALFLDMPDKIIYGSLPVKAS